MRFVKLTTYDNKDIFLNVSLIESFNNSGNHVDLRFNGGTRMTLKEADADALVCYLTDAVSPLLPHKSGNTLTIKDPTLVKFSDVWALLVAWVKGVFGVGAA